MHLCGVRGSTPAPGEEFVRYGGHTSCVALARDDDAANAPGNPPTLLLDAGTGIRRVTALLGEVPFVGAIVLTHLHWDHVQGLPFFRGGDRDDAQVMLALPRQENGSDAEAVLARMMSPPNFPIRPSQLRGDWSFHGAFAGPVDLGDLCGFSVEALEVPHKGGRTFGYRVSDGHSSLAYIPDHCPTVLGPGPDGLGEYHETAMALADGVDVLIHDAHLLAEELPAEAAFGHAAAEYAVALGCRAGARRVVLFHHRPDRTDEALDRFAERFAGSPVEVTVAVEETVLAL